MAFEGPAEDRLAIRELTETYADAVCRNDVEAWKSTWMEESLWSFPDVPQLGSIRGRQAICDTWSAIMSGLPGLVLSSIPGSLKVEGDSATGCCYVADVYDDASGHCVRSHGRYDDVFAKSHGKWRFVSRTFTSLYPKPSVAAAR